jgi:hypothetical protein
LLKKFGADSGEPGRFKLQSLAPIDALGGMLWRAACGFEMESPIDDCCKILIR